MIIEDPPDSVDHMPQYVAHKAPNCFGSKEQFGQVLCLEEKTIYYQALYDNIRSFKPSSFILSVILLAKSNSSYDSKNKGCIRNSKGRGQLGARGGR